MQKIMFNDRYGLTNSVLNGIKNITRREAFYYDNAIDCCCTENGKLIVVDEKTREIVHKSRYGAGEIVAIAQSYSSIFDEAYDDYFNDKYSSFRNVNFTITKGWKNKMFVKAEYMPHHIKITNIRCERLQDISKEDCLKEGVFLSAKGYYYIGNCETKFYYAEQSFKYIIGKLNGKKFWDTNPYVIVYEFELV